MGKYDASSLKSLEGLEAVRKRPGMYIGSTDSQGLHHLVWEMIDNGIDEVLAKSANKIKVVLKQDGSIIVEDNGRGIPVDMHKPSGKSGVELVFSELHAGGKFDEKGAYRTAGGLHGVGASVVNALSTKVVVSVFRQGHHYLTTFENTHVKEKTHQVEPTHKTGTRVQFWPDKSIFRSVKFDYDRIWEKLRESAFLTAGLTVKLRSEIDNRQDELVSHHGIADFVHYIDESKNNLTKAFVFKGGQERIEVEIGFQYNADYAETIVSFVNNIKTIGGGTHEQGFKVAWTKVINEYARQQNLIKPKESNLDGSDIREGLTAVISLRIPEKMLEFVGQTKESLRTPAAKGAVESVINNKLAFWLQEQKELAHKIIQKSLVASRARKAARKARDEARSAKKTLQQTRIISGKLTPAQSKNPLERELFLVEGDSAGGSAKLARDHRHQAILPLRGKVINSEKARLVDVLKNEEIATVINTIGAGVGKDFSLKDCQYGKVIIMTDADTDGAHIQTLLLTFFFRYMRQLVAAGGVYIALAPLYRVAWNEKGQKAHRYAWNDHELSTLLEEHPNSEIQRYKGLGEMNPHQLWETTMDPSTRTLVKIKIDNVAQVERQVSVLMGDKVEPRKNWINRHVKFTMEDDFAKPKGRRV